jgi:hypothetical protein
MSGFIASAEHNDDLPGNGQWDDPWNTTNGYDVVSIGYSLQAPPGVSGFCVDSWFFSREFSAQQAFNDRFYILLDAPVTTGGQPTPINYMPCPNPATFSSFTGEDGVAYCYIGVSPGFEQCGQGTGPDLGATGYTCGYGWMQTCWPIAALEDFELRFVILDSQDSIYDSGALADHFQWQYGAALKGTWFLD